MRKHSKPGDPTASVEAKQASLVRTSKGFAITFFAAAAIVAFLVVVVTVQYVAGVIASESDPGDSPAASPLSIVAFCIFLAILILIAFVFRDVARGESPFTNKQARRIRAAAWLLFLFAVLDSFIPKGVLVGTGNGGDAPSLVHTESSFGYYGVNIGWFVIAMVFFALSSIFKYGVELQELSDDTV